MPWAWMPWWEWRSTKGSCQGSSFRGNEDFRFANRLLVQVPGVNGFSTSFASEAGAELSLGIVEGFFGVHAGAVGFVIGVVAFAGGERCRRVSLHRYGLLAMRRDGSGLFRDQRFVGRSDRLRPALSDG